MNSPEQQVKNSLIYFLPIIVNSLLPFISLSIFSRILTREDYGILALAQIYAIFVSGLANFGMTTAYDRNFFQYRHNRNDSARLLYSILMFISINFILLAVLTYICRSVLSQWIIGSARHGDILFLSFCAQYFIGINYYYLAFYKNSENATSYMFYSIAVSVINFILVCYFIIFLKTGIYGIIYGQLFSGGFVFCFLTIKFIQMMPPCVSRTIFLDTFNISWPLTPRIFLGVLNSQFDKYMIGLLASVGGVGVYSIGQKLSYVIFTFMTALQNVFSPSVYKQMFLMGETGGISIGKYLTPFIYVSIAVSLAIALFSEEIITILTPPSYHGAIDVVIILSLFYATMFFGKQPQLIYSRKTHITSLLTVVHILLNISLNIPFILRWGTIGAAWATLLAGLVSGTISFVISQKYYRISWEYPAITRIYLILFISSFALIIMRNLDMPYQPRLIIKILSLGFYIWLGMRINILNLKNYLLLKRVVTFKKS